MSRKYNIFGSFDFALTGLRDAFRNEPNFRIHTLIGLIALVLATLLGFSPTEWVILFFAISLVLILELINTSLEAITDIVSPEKKVKAKLAKDVSASAVFVASLVAMLVGVLLFLPKLPIY